MIVYFDTAGCGWPWACLWCSWIVISPITDWLVSKTVSCSGPYSFVDFNAFYVTCPFSMRIAFWDYPSISTWLVWFRHSKTVPISGFGAVTSLFCCSYLAFLTTRLQVDYPRTASVIHILIDIKGLFSLSKQHPSCCLHCGGSILRADTRLIGPYCILPYSVLCGSQLYPISLTKVSSLVSRSWLATSNCLSLS